MWSCGCVLGELFTGLPIFEENGEDGILIKIFSILGKTGEDSLIDRKSLKNPNACECLDMTNHKLLTVLQLKNRGCNSTLTEQGIDLLKRLLCLNSNVRASSSEALQHSWFQEKPFPKINLMIT